MVRQRLLIAIAFAGLTTACDQQRVDHKPDSPLVASSDDTAPEEPSPVPKSAVIDDFGIERHLVSLLGSQEPPKSLELPEIGAQLKRQKTAVRLLKMGEAQMAPEALYSKRLKSVALVVGRPTMCDQCPDLHLSSTAGGFFISSDGICVTNWHVVGETESSLYVMTFDQKIYGVSEILAADEATDVAILKVAGSGFEAAPLTREDPRVGSRVAVISHPSGRYFSFTEGRVSRHSLEPRFRKSDASGTTDSAKEPARGDRQMMTITADFGSGSSGGPVFDFSGNVVGMVAATETFYGDELQYRDPQMVLKLCVPSTSILALIDRL